MCKKAKQQFYKWMKKIKKNNINNNTACGWNIKKKSKYK